MSIPEIQSGVVHEVPKDITDMLITHPDVLEKWNNLTPLARNERICWTTIVKKQETREKHILRLCEDLRDSKKRPCCRP
jgi:uncharacterized protein YdeI (YjbR/CyaY-like superfamily)